MNKTHVLSIQSFKKFNRRKVSDACLFFTALCLIVFLLPGCLPRYGLANSGGDPIFFTKPVYKDSAVVATYVGGKFCQTADSAYFHKNESSYFGELYLYRSHSQKFFNYAYGIFGYQGSYRVAQLEQFKGNKHFYGGGVSGEMNLNLPVYIVDMRLFGVRGSAWYEGGDFYSFRKYASDQGLIENVNTSHLAYNISFMQEYNFRLNNSSVGFYHSLGTTSDLEHQYSYLTYTSTLFFTYKRFTSYAQYTICTFGIGRMYSLGMSYQILSEKREAWNDLK